MKNLLNLRKQKNISQQKLAKELNISQQVLSRYERNEREADYATLEKIANYFNVSIDYLLGHSTYFFPDNINLSFEELNLITDFRELSPELQIMLTETIKTWKRADALKAKMSNNN